MSKKGVFFWCKNVSEKCPKTGPKTPLKHPPRTDPLFRKSRTVCVRNLAPFYPPVRGGCPGGYKMCAKSVQKWVPKCVQKTPKKNPLFFIFFLKFVKISFLVPAPETQIFTKFLWFL